jgi:hypothetical protein
VTCFTLGGIQKRDGRSAGLIASAGHTHQQRGDAEQRRHDGAPPLRLRIAICAVITLAATALMTDYTGKDISGDFQSR